MVDMTIKRGEMDLHEVLSQDRLYVAECFANNGPIMKRIQPRARGSAYRINKRMSHLTVILDEKGGKN